MPKLPIKGAYEDRGAMAGDHEGQQAFFRRENGDIMMCNWSGAAGCWADIGVVQSSAEAEDSWDVKRTITLDLEGGGLATKELKFNQDGEFGSCSTRARDCLSSFVLPCSRVRRCVSVVLGSQRTYTP
jgi:hypothetical protein